MVLKNVYHAVLENFSNELSSFEKKSFFQFSQSDADHNALYSEGKEGRGE